MISRFSARLPLIVAMACVVIPQPVLAGASPWEDVTGAKLRIITEALQPDTETLLGALQIELQPGWKTYWLEPGSAGIPPQITVSGGATDVTIHFPAPRWVDDPYGSWAGYTEPVSLPLSFTLEDRPGTIETDVFLGICRDVCIPVTANFSVPVGSSSGSNLQTIQVKAAFAELPGGNTEALSIGEPAWTEDGLLEIRVEHPGEDRNTQLFLSAGANHPFKKPALVESGSGYSLFRVEPAFDPTEIGTIDLLAIAKHGLDAAEISVSVAAP